MPPATHAAAQCLWHHTQHSAFCNTCSTWHTGHTASSSSTHQQQQQHKVLVCQDELVLDRA
eukprot:1154837-Pelagomonas_calceolata.AAC.2